jgi:hypothetical protein
MREIVKTDSLFSLACAAVLLGSAALADWEKAKVNLSSWDMDSDKAVSQQEWTELMEQYDFFDMIDANNNGVFDTDEAMDGALDYDLSMDRDHGGNIDGEEFLRGVFDQHDANNDDKLDNEEWAEFAVNSDGSPLFN